MSALLINEPPLQVLPSLAIKIGLAEAIIVQQIHYWLQRTKPMDDGFCWVYNSVSEWKKQFPFWHENTIASHLKNLRESGILITDSKANNPLDRTLYYRIDYTKLGESIPQELCKPLNKKSEISIYTETTKDYFLEFWKAYPKKVAQETAIKAWKKLKVDDELFNKMIKAIKDQDLINKDKQFVPNPSTWLNGKRWKDEVTVKQYDFDPMLRRAK